MGMRLSGGGGGGGGGGGRFGGVVDGPIDQIGTHLILMQ